MGHWHGWLAHRRGSRRVPTERGAPSNHRTLLKSAGPLAPKDVAEALGKNASTTRVLLRNMLADGQVVVEDGRYKAVNSMNGINDEQGERLGVYGVYGSSEQDALADDPDEHPPSEHELWVNEDKEAFFFPHRYSGGRGAA
jgi:hypothetical protein